MTPPDGAAVADRDTPVDHPPSSLVHGLARWQTAAIDALTAEPAAQSGAAPMGPRFEARGRVHSTADGLARVTGLAGVRLNELLLLPDGVTGYAASLEPDEVACVLLDHPQSVRVGQTVLRSGDVVRVPVGPGLLGRVVDPLGRPLDGLGPITAADHLPAERPAPSIIDRAAVRQPVHTGTLAVDALFPLGRGQRELIIGDRGTGKTAMAVDALIAQRATDMVCIYVAIGQRSEAVASAIAALHRYGAPERTIVVVASGAEPPGLQWLAPFAGFSMAEYFRDRGDHALVVLDDLSQHAACHRELALLMLRPPGREAYPGDIFHVHARLLERAAMLSPERGGGSLTALPIARTEAGNLSAYIPTNLISITDGQIVLDTRLFHLGQLPAVDTGLSVSRVGGKTQSPLMRQVVGPLRLAYAQFLEVEMFTRFGTELEASVRARIERGRRIRAVLAQPRLDPLPIPLQLALLLLVQGGALDDWPAARWPDLLGTLRHALAAEPALTEALGSSAAIDAAGLSALRAQAMAQLGPALREHAVADQPEPPVGSATPAAPTAAP